MGVVGGWWLWMWVHREVAGVGRGKVITCQVPTFENAETLQSVIQLSLHLHVPMILKFLIYSSYNKQVLFSGVGLVSLCGGKSDALVIICHPYSLLPWGSAFATSSLAKLSGAGCIAENFTVRKGKKESDITAAHCVVNGCPFYISAAPGGEDGIAVYVLQANITVWVHGQYRALGKKTSIWRRRTTYGLCSPLHETKNANVYYYITRLLNFSLPASFVHR